MLDVGLTAVLDEELLPSLTDQLVHLDLFLTLCATSLQPRELVERLHSPAVFLPSYGAAFKALYSWLFNTLVRQN